MAERRNSIGDDVPNRIRQDENGGIWRQNQAEIREYAAIAKEIAVHQAGQRICYSFIVLAKIILFICAFYYEGILPKIFVGLIMIGIGLRFCWWQWTKKEIVFREPMW